MRKAKEIMIEAVRNDFTNRFAQFVEDGTMRLFIAHTDNDEEAKIFAEEVQAAFPNVPVSYIDPLSLSVSCHIGPGSLAVAMAREL